MHRTWTFLSEFRETLPDCASWSPLGAHILFSTVMNPAQMAEGRMKALRSYLLSIESKNIDLPPGPATAENVAHPNVFDSTVWQKMKEESERLRSRPPTALPCANVQPAEDTMICKDPGTMACSACKLVSYCSKVGNKPYASLFSLNGCFRNAKQPTGSVISEVKWFYIHIAKPFGPVTICRLQEFYEVHGLDT